LLYWSAAEAGTALLSLLALLVRGACLLYWSARCTKRG
jgi:hypothetical protein